MHRFSIIVPLLDDRRLFDNTLASVLRYRPNSSQIIVAHDGTYDDPYNLQGEVDFVSTSSRSHLVRLFTEAIGESTGDFVALIRPGVEVASSWHEPVELKFEDANVASVAPIVVAPSQPQTIVAAGVTNEFGFRRRVVGAKSRIAPRNIRRIAPLGPTSWAAFYRRSALDPIGTSTQQLDPHYLDLDIALSLKTMGHACAFCPECVVNVERSSLIMRELLLPHGKSAQRAYRRHAAQLGSTSSLVQSACAFTQELLMSPFQPWKLQHACERWRAWPMAKLDRQYAEGLWHLAQDRREREECGLESWIETGPDNSSSTHRAA